MSGCLRPRQQRVRVRRHIFSDSNFFLLFSQSTGSRERRRRSFGLTCRASHWSSAPEVERGPTLLRPSSPTQLSGPGFQVPRVWSRGSPARPGRQACGFRWDGITARCEGRATAPAAPNSPGFCPSPSAPSFPLSGDWAEAVYDSPGSAKSEVFLGGWVESESTPTASLSMGTGQRRTFKTTLQRRWLGWEGLDEGFRSLSDCTQS